MCELTVSNLGLKKLNTLYMLQQLMRNSVEHPDGTGIWNSQQFWKTRLQAMNTTNLGEVFSDIITHGITMGHVRKTSTVNIALGVSDENSHPFSGKRFTFAHNGTMETIIPADMRKLEYRGLIDSAIFHAMLEESAEESPNLPIVELLNQVYSNWTGKFAFLLHDKKFNKFYACRGETATLFMANVTMVDNDGQIAKTGYVINTERQHLVQGLVGFSNAAQVVTGMKVLWPKEDIIVELPKNSIFEVKNSSVEKIGELTEAKKYLPATTTATAATSTTTSTASGVKIGGTGFSGSGGVKSLIEDKYIEMIQAFILKWRINIEYFDMMCYLYFDKGLLELTKEEISDIAGMIRFYENSSIKHKKLLRAWGDILDKGISPLNVHKNTSVTFPYMKEISMTTLRDAEDIIEKENKKKLVA